MSKSKWKYMNEEQRRIMEMQTLRSLESEIPALRRKIEDLENYVDSRIKKLSELGVE